MLGVVAAAGGRLLDGFLSDKLKRRRLFVPIAAVLFVAGAAVEAFASFLAPADSRCRAQRSRHHPWRLGAEKNHTLLYLTGAVPALPGGLVIALKVKQFDS